MGAYIVRDQDRGRDPRTVREFVSEFRGLSGTAKQKRVLEEIGASRLSLPEFFGNDDRINNDRIAKLLAAMKRESRPVKPKELGLIGKDHLAVRFEAAGANLETFEYRRIFGEMDGVPHVIETAFAKCLDGADERRIITSVNWSPAIGKLFVKTRAAEVTKSGRGRANASFSKSFSAVPPNTAIRSSSAILVGVLRPQWWMKRLVRENRPAALTLPYRCLSRRWLSICR